MTLWLSPAISSPEATPERSGGVEVGGRTLFAVISLHQLQVSAVWIAPPFYFSVLINQLQVISSVADGHRIMEDKSR